MVEAHNEWPSDVGVEVPVEIMLRPAESKFCEYEGVLEIFNERD